MKKNEVKANVNETPKTEAIPEEQLDNVTGGRRYYDTLDDWEFFNDPPDKSIPGGVPGGR